MALVFKRNPINLKWVYCVFYIHVHIIFVSVANYLKDNLIVYCSKFLEYLILMRNRLIVLEEQ